ncbi:MAG: hypothetical protein WKH64_13805 [Chloroflexia bacterium]
MRELAEARIPTCLRPDPDPVRLRTAIEQMAAKDKRVYLKLRRDLSPDYAAAAPHRRARPGVVGEHDVVTPRALSEELHKGVPGSTLRVVPNAGHISNLDNPTDFNAAVRSFLLHHNCT